MMSELEITDCIDGAITDAMHINNAGCMNSDILAMVLDIVYKLNQATIEGCIYVNNQDAELIFKMERLIQLRNEARELEDKILN